MDKKTKIYNIRKFSGYALIALFAIAMVCTRIFFGSVIAVSGLSMYPTFNNGDFVFGTVMHDDTPLADGDIIILKEDDGRFLIKRIVGMPGETISDMQKGIPLTTLGEDEYYVVGDNYEVSRDSRDFGAINRDDIKFKYADIHWTPFTLITTLVLPAILLISAITIVLIPADKKENPEESAVNDDPTASAAVDVAKTSEEATITEDTHVE